MANVTVSVAVPPYDPPEDDPDDAAVLLPDAAAVLEAVDDEDPHPARSAAVMATPVARDTTLLKIPRLIRFPPYLHLFSFYFSTAASAVPPRPCVKSG
jgi:hypothetical protein